MARPTPEAPGAARSRRRSPAPLLRVQRPQPPIRARGRSFSSCGSPCFTRTTEESPNHRRLAQKAQSSLQFPLNEFEPKVQPRLWQEIVVSTSSLCRGIRCEGVKLDSGFRRNDVAGSGPGYDVVPSPLAGEGGAM